MTVEEVRAAVAAAAGTEPAAVEVRVTHISQVFLTRDRAYKLKKPLVLAFLDYGTPERRRAMCREEVRLNRRLAGGIYLGVRALAPRGDGLALVAEDHPDAVDYVVEMKRYADADTLAATFARGELRRPAVVAVARALARFHDGAARVLPAGPLRPALAVQRRMDEDSHELLAIVDQRGEAERVLALERFAHAFAAAREPTLDTRARTGMVREGHGDLRAEHVLLGEGGEPVRFVDCIEFARGLRELDVADDLAFLVMDLAWQRGDPVARALVAAYREAGGDPGDDALIAFYASNRALVRAKVSLLRAAQHPPGSAAHGRASAAGRDLLALAERFSWRARLPLAVVVCGPPASGKSHLARALAAGSGLPHLCSDVARKRLLGIAPRARAPAEAYGAELNRRTYADLGRRAAAAIGACGGALVDATFRHRADRDAFARAFAGTAPLLFVECRAPAAVLARRAAHRDEDPARISDATRAVVRSEAARWDPLDEVAPAAHVTLRTDRAVEAVLSDLLGLLDRRLGRLAVRAAEAS